MERMHGVVAAALGELGVHARPHVPSPADQCPGCLCFQHFTAGDLMVGPAKVVGSAQRRQRGALLQHGAILLATSPYTPALPGIAELSGRLFTPDETCAAVRQAFVRATGWACVDDDWTAAERAHIERLVAEKYSCALWNCKR